MARRRMGQELKDFTTAFLQGYKIFSDGDRRGGRSNDPYSDENLAKNDSRLGGGSFFGKLFGGGDEALTGPDRGRAAIDAQMRIAIERGDYKKLEELMQGSKKFELLTKNPLVGEKPGKEPEAAVPVPGRRTDADPENKDKKVVALKQEDPEKDDTETETFDPNQTNNRLVAKLGFEPDADSPLRYGADWTDVGSKISSIFTAGGGMVPHMSRGGAVPTQYAALGASVIDPKGDTGGLVGERGTPRSAIPLQQDDEAVDYYEGDPNDIRDPEEEEGTPVRPMGPAVNPEQAPDVASGKSLDLPTEPQALAGVAARAVKAGLDRINDEFKGEGALGTPSPNRAALVRAFANNEGRFTDEEVAQIDKIIDPDNKLPPDMKSAARIAAIYKFYEDDGDPETARNAAARMLLYNKHLSQRLGAEALEAFRNGNLEKGIERLTSAYNDTLPDGQQIRASVNDDGSVTYSVGYERDGEWVETGGGRTDKNGLIQLASNTARSDAYMTRLYAITESLKAAKGGGKGGATTGASSNDFLSGVEGVRTAAEALKAARADGDPDKIAQAEADLRAKSQAVLNMPYHKTRNGDTSVELTRRQNILKSTINGALGASSASGTPRAGSGTAEERETAANERALADLRRKRQALDDTRVSPFESQDQIDLRRRQLEEIDNDIAEIGTRGAKRTARADETPEKRAEPYMTALLGEEMKDENGKPVIDPKTKQPMRSGGVLTEGVITKSGKADADTRPRPMSRSEQLAFQNIFARVGHLNDGVMPRTLAESLYRMTFETGGPQPKVDPRDGSIIFDGEKLFIDRLSLQQMSAMRKAELGKLAAREAKTIRDRNAQEEAARAEQEAINRREEERKAAIKAMQDKVDAGTATTGPFSETNAVQGARAIGERLKRMEQFNLRRKQMMQERAIGGE